MNSPNGGHVSQPTSLSSSNVTVPGGSDPYDLVIRADRAILPGGEQPAQIGVRAGRIATVTGRDEPLLATETLDLGPGEVLLPGLVDTHVHVNEPGRTEWEGFASATRAAAAGGVTTIVDMPLNSFPPTTNVAALEVKRETARNQAFVDVGFWGGAVPGNVEHLPALHEAGVLGFKCFLLDSGVPEFPPLGPDELEQHLQVVAGLDALMIVHAESGAVVQEAPRSRRYADFLASRSPQAEEEAIGQVIDAARSTGARVHIVHLSHAGALPMIARAKAEGVRLTVETCPHYLTLDAQSIPDGATTYKCCPPIRNKTNQDGLWQGLADGTIDIIVSDHSPSTAALKGLDSGDFGTAWGGISSLQLGLAAVWTNARARRFTLEHAARWMAAGPANLVGLGRKGAIAEGRDADLSVFDPEGTFVVDPAQLHHKNPLTAYAGQELTGVVRRTLLRGRWVSDVPQGTLIGGHP